MERFKAIIFDLDGTLIPEEEANDQSFLEASQYASQRYELNPIQLATLARAHARMLFYNHPSYAFSKKIGAGAAESLCAPFLSNQPDVEKLREFSTSFRTGAWSNALKEMGYSDPRLAQELAQLFVQIRQNHYQMYPRVEELLQSLQPLYKMAILTNGFSCLQKEKIRRSGLSNWIDIHVVSEDIGVGKPHPDIFRATFKQLGTTKALMVGNSLENDYLGAIGAGIPAIWISSAEPKPFQSTIPTLPHVTNILQYLR